MIFRVRNVFGDHMVVQRGKPVRVAGVAAPGAAVCGTFRGGTARTVADAGGEWALVFPPGEAGGPFSMSLECGGAGAETAEIRDILVGDVWFCSGQSNMEFPVWGEDTFFRLRDGEAVAAAARDGRLRLFLTPFGVAPDGPRADAPEGGAWRAADTPEAVRPFGAAAYWFGRALRNALEGDVPVGLVLSAKCGTPIEAWSSEEALRRAMRDGAPDPAETAKARHDQWDWVRTPTTLYNAMVAPFTAVEIRGVAWYQGCDNACAPEGYIAFFRAWAASWRRAWRDDALPIVATQLSACAEHRPNHRLPDDFWRDDEPDARPGFAPMRAVQERLAAEDPRMGLVCTIDVGDHSSVHPMDKRPVGFRIAHEALRVAYGRADAIPAPRIASAAREGSAIRLRFSNSDGGLAAGPDGIGPHLFAVAGVDHRYFWADARLEPDSSVVVRSASVPGPVFVRYAHSAFPPGPLIRRRSDGLPVHPFAEVRATGEPSESQHT